MTRWGGRKVSELRDLVIATYGDVCCLCGHRGSNTVEHVIPRARGGTDDIENLRPAHKSCNVSRQDSDVNEWRKRKGIGVHRAPPSRDWYST